MTDIEKVRDLVYRFTRDSIRLPEYLKLMWLMDDDAQTKEYAKEHGVEVERCPQCEHDHRHTGGCDYPACRDGSTLNVMVMIDLWSSERRFKATPVTGES